MAGKPSGVSICLRVCCAIPQCFLAVMIIIVGNMIAAIISSPESSFYVSGFSDAGDCFVLLHPQSLDGDTLQLYSLDVKDGHVLVEKNASTGIVDMSMQVRVENPLDYNLQGSKLIKSEACSLVMEPYKARTGKDGTFEKDLTIFRHGQDGLPSLKFDLCEPYACDTYYDPPCNIDDLQKWDNFSDVGAYKAAFETQDVNPFVSFEMSRAGEQTCMVLILVAWALFKLGGFIAEIITSQMDDAPKLMIMAFKWVMFTGLPAQLLAPWTSLHVHEDCPQMAIWLLPTRASIFLAVIFCSVLVLFLLFCVSPVLACVGKGELAGKILVGCSILIGFEIVILWIIEIFWDFPQFPSFPIYWNLLFDFSWPEYSLAWTTSWFRLFAFLIVVWETGFQGCGMNAAIHVIDKGSD